MKSKKKVLFLINSPEIGGSQRIFAELMEVLPRDGVATQLAFLYGPPEMMTRNADNSVSFGFRNTWDIAALWRLRTYARAHSVTHILATLEQSSIVARLAGWLMWDVRIVISEPGMADRKPLFYKCLDIALNIRTDALVAGSKKVRDSLLTYQPFYRYKMPVVLNGVVVPVPPAAHTPEPLFTILAVGSLRQEKGFTYLLDAFRIFLSHTNGNVQLIVIGGGPLEGSLKQQAIDAGIASNVRFLGEMGFKETSGWYLRAHCFALSSLSEGGPLVVLEAMAHELPVVSTRVGGVPETIVDGVSGLLVTPGSASELAVALERVYGDESLRSRLAQGGYERVRDHFSFDEHVRKLRAVLKL